MLAMLASLFARPCVSRPYPKQHELARPGGGIGLAEIGARLAGLLQGAHTGLSKWWGLGRSRNSDLAGVWALSPAWHCYASKILDKMCVILAKLCFVVLAVVLWRRPGSKGKTFAFPFLSFLFCSPSNSLGFFPGFPPHSPVYVPFSDLASSRMSS